MGSRSCIRRRVLRGIVIIILLLLFGISLDMNSALLVSLGFGASLSLWSLSYIHESSFLNSQANSN